MKYRRRQTIMEKVLAKIAKKNGLTIDQVTGIEDSQWKLVKQQINATNTETEESSNIYIRFLGTIVCPPNKIKKVKENLNDNNR